MRALVPRTHWTTQVEDTSGRAVLDRNENCDAGLRTILAERFLKELDPACLIRYPNLREAYLELAELTRLPPERLFLAAGSEQLIRALLYSHSPKKFGVTRPFRLYYPAPTYAMVAVYGELFGYELKPVVYQYLKAERRFALDTELFLQADEHDVVYLPSPDNLTGRLFDTSLIQCICSTRCLVILDHAYIAFAGEGVCEEHQALAERFSSLVIVSSFSKAAGVAGLRVGHLFGHPDAIARVYEDKPMYEVSGIACAYISFLARNRGLIGETVSQLLMGKTLLESGFAKADVIALESAGNFSVFEDTDLFDKFRKIANVRSFEVNGSRFVRITASDASSTRIMLERI